jgi:hypothetical protein
MAEDKTPHPSFRAVEKLGIMYPGLDEGLKKNPLAQLGYDPKIIIQQITDTSQPFQKLSKSGLYSPPGAYDPEDTPTNPLEKEMQRRNLNKAVYVEPDTMYGPAKEYAYNDDFSKKEKKLLNEYFGNLPAEDVLIHELMHSGIQNLSEIKGKNALQADDHWFMGAMDILEADEKFKKPLIKYYKSIGYDYDKFFKNIKTGSGEKVDLETLYGILKKRQEDAKQELKKDIDTPSEPLKTEKKAMGGLVDKPLYERA